jgi:rhodanese-related sulfurtransferase
LRVDRAIPSVLLTDLYGSLGTASAPVIVDVRSDDEIHVADRLIPGAIHRPSEDIQSWWGELPASRRVVVHDRSGGERSLRVAEALRQFGTNAGHLVDGFSGWHASGLPTRRIVAAPSGQWVTREHPKIDRIACPWLVRRFINPLAEFIYVPADRVLEVAEKTGATPYDIEGVEFTHEDERCSFDKILRVHDIGMPALDRLAAIVRGADTSRHDLAPECEGLFAISRGLSANFPDDHEMLQHGMVIYDALYSWCRLQTGTGRT